MLVFLLIFFFKNQTAIDKSVIFYGIYIYTVYNAIILNIVYGRKWVKQFDSP